MAARESESSVRDESLSENYQPIDGHTFTRLTQGVADNLKDAVWRAFVRIYTARTYDRIGEQLGAAVGHLVDDLADALMAWSDRRTVNYRRAVDVSLSLTAEDEAER
jgi:hypothetical protein